LCGGPEDRSAAGVFGFILKATGQAPAQCFKVMGPCSKVIAAMVMAYNYIE